MQWLTERNLRVCRLYESGFRLVLGVAVGALLVLVCNAVIPALLAEKDPVHTLSWRVFFSLASYHFYYSEFLTPIGEEIGWRGCASKAAGPRWPGLGLCLDRARVGRFHVACSGLGSNVERYCHPDVCRWPRFPIRGDDFCCEPFGVQHHRCNSHAHFGKRPERILVTWFDCTCSASGTLGVGLVGLHPVGCGVSRFGDTGQPWGTSPERFLRVAVGRGRDDHR